MAFKFPSFTYQDLANKVGQGYGEGSGTFTDPGALTAPTGLSFDKALAYGLMQSFDPKARSAARKEELQDLLTLQKEQMRQAAPYKLMFELPDKVMKAFAAPAQISSNIRLAGQGAANQLISQGLQASALNMPSMGYQRPSTQYF
jgi:hypothetical protein